FVNVLMAVQRHNGVLKASIASATNAHRLGGHEAPPAIISAFLGRTMSAVLRKILDVPSDTPIRIAGKKERSVGLIEIPEIFVDNTDRNRTSPFAFTGNRFEFRAVGSSANCAGALTTLNAAVAEQLIDFKKALDVELEKGKTLQVAVMDTLKPIIAQIIDTICFDGNGYSEEWQQEARRRGLDTETRVPEMFKAFTTPESVAMFTRTGVYTEKELAARNEVKWDIYIKKVQIESRVMVRMAINHIIPAAVEYKTRLLKEVALNQQVLGQDGCGTELELIRRIGGLIEEVSDRAESMRLARKRANTLEGEYDRAMAYYAIASQIEELRRPIDKLEELVDNQLWPLPKYRELLFIS
ncbi:MAG: glutamine synthetase type III, partial [Bacteroidales bacterium]|nr:glutamine synthetase type III [Bacteroidales bacterium]